ncbi:MAG TPA: lysyl oxidase family protein [Anaerolineales bacterium]|nr:lysyl oxidase family protein [Anaerolineales bacterium]
MAPFWQSLTPTPEPPLFLPDLQALPPFDLAIEVFQGGDLKRLRLSVSVVNHGPGALELLGVSDFSTRSTLVTQHIDTRDGTRLEFPVGSFIFHTAHNHWHLEDFATYDLWSLTRSGGLKDLVASNTKVSFCLRDLRQSDPAVTSADAAYTACERELQGLSTGWVDTYRSHLPGQHINISEVPDGLYAVRVTFDPLNYLLEMEEYNNSAWVTVAISGGDVRLIDDWASLKLQLDTRLR